MPPAWVGEAGGERFAVGNRSLREAHDIPREERVLEIACGRSLVGVVYPRGRRYQWRLRLLDVDGHLLPQDDPEELDRDVYEALGEEPPADLARRARFKCLCGALHVLDRDAVLATAELYEPSSRAARARRIDLRRVAHVIRGAGT